MLAGCADLFPKLFNTDRFESGRRFRSKVLLFILFSVIRHLVHLVYVISYPHLEFDSEDVQKHATLGTSASIDTLATYVNACVHIRTTARFIHPFWVFTVVKYIVGVLRGRVVKAILDACRLCHIS